MKGNKIECNCDMAWLKDYSPLSTDVTCFSPPQLARREIRDLSYEELNCGMIIESPMFHIMLKAIRMWAMWAITQEKPHSN